VEAGLVDGLAHPVPKLKELYGDKVRLIGHAPRRPLLRRLGMGGIGGVDAGALAGALEDRALWARYGL
jgi:serine protease SohB